MKEEFNVLSLFDGMSCGQIALNRAGIKYDNYFASEIDQAAITVTQKNYPNTIQLGDITKIKASILPKIDLIIGGSPCQDISNLNKFRLGLDGDKSSLFYHYYRLRNETKATNFLLENVRGNKKAENTITKLMGKRPISFCSSLVCAQTRNRKYWTDIHITSIPKNKQEMLSDILQKDVSDKFYLTESNKNWLYNGGGQKSREKRYTSINPTRALCLTKRYPKAWNGTIILDHKGERYLTPEECEILQTVPVGYTDCVKDGSRYEMLGNGWTVDIIAHIFSFLPTHLI